VNPSLPGHPRCFQPSIDRQRAAAIVWLVVCAAGLLLATARGQDTSDPTKIAPLEHQFREQWVGQIVPSHLVDLFEEGVFPFSRGRLQDRQFRYRLFRPQRDPGLPDARYPLLVWTSGYGEMGDDNFAQLRHLQFVFTDPENGRKKPFYCLVLQSPADLKQWFDGEGKEAEDDVASVLLALVERIMKVEPIDPERVYLAGISAGGGVCWELLERRPDLFAAVAPLAGPGCGSDPAVMATIRDVPVWAFHAARDPLLPATSAQETIAALRAAGGSAALTEVDSDYHDCWTAAFRDWRLMDWLLLQKRGRRSWLTPPGRRPIDWPVVGGVAALVGITAVAIRQELQRQRRSR